MIQPISTSKGIFIEGFDSETKKSIKKQNIVILIKNINLLNRINTQFYLNIELCVLVLFLIGRNAACMYFNKNYIAILILSDIIK